MSAINLGQLPARWSIRLTWPLDPRLKTEQIIFVHLQSKQVTFGLAQLGYLLDEFPASIYGEIGHV